ncbi:hypothetical protein BS78_09G013800 [Paspalum vaginatum]|nr:hypothetical protein BS78_09G013800 [Paspalum vaginatum]
MAAADEGTTKGGYFAIAPVRLQQNVLLMTLYVHQVVVPRSNPSFGLIAANDWTVFDGMGGGANLVGNMQGLHMLGSMTQGSWCVYFDLWAIVGGTGEFTLAQGVISFKNVQDGGSMNIRELSSVPSMHPT